MRLLRIAAMLACCVLAGAALGQQAAATVASAPASFGNLPLQRAEGGAGGAWGWSGALLAVAAAAVLVGGLQYLRQRRGVLASKAPGWWPGKAAPGGLRTVQTVRLTQGASLHVVRWGSQELLLACTPAAVTLVSTRADADDMAEDGAARSPEGGA